MTTPAFGDIAHVSLPNRGERGMFAMLEFYFDDSGTHSGSPIVVWGGIVGYKDFVVELEAKWKERLSQPCDHKPPIKAFHSSHLAAGSGEFEGYNQAERDLTRYNFRKIILDTGVTVLSFGISVRDWDAIVRGPARSVLGSAERCIFGQAVLASCSAAKKEGMALSFQFDSGRRRQELDSIIQPAIDAAEIESRFVSYGFSPIAFRPALQAADLVAHESFQFLSKYIVDPEATASTHLQRLFDGAHDARVAWLGRQEIQSMVAKMQPTLREIEANWAGKSGK